MKMILKVIERKLQGKKTYFSIFHNLVFYIRLKENSMIFKTSIRTVNNLENICKSIWSPRQFFLFFENFGIFICTFKAGLVFR